jgi:hypothetical protein
MLEKRSVVISQRRSVFVLGALLYAVLLQGAYINGIVPFWAYLGYIFAPPPGWLWAAVTVMAIIPVLWMPVTLSRPSQWLYLYLYMTVFVPACLLTLFRGIALGQAPREILPFIGVLLLCMALLGLIYRFPLLDIPRIRLSREAFWGVVGCYLVFAYVVVYRAFGDSLRIVSLNDVLEQRLGGRDIVATTTVPAGLLGYCMNYPAYVINPLLLSIGLWFRRPIIFLLGAAGQVYLYAANAVRSPIAAILILCLLLVSIRQKRFSFANFWIWIMAGTVLVGCMLPYIPFPVVQNQISWIILRTLIGPGYITGIYHDFFSSNPQTLFSQVSGLGWLAHNPYPGTSLGLVIGASLGQPDNQANANLWADGFASFGFTGMLVVTVLLAAIFYLMDSATKKIDPGLATLMIGVHVLNIADLPIFTAFLGGGLGLTILLIYLLPITQSPVGKIVPPGG